MNAAPVLVAVCWLLAGCATPLFNNVSNAPWPTSAPVHAGEAQDRMGENSIVLSFSGGGLRASAFAYGVLAALEERKTADGDLLGDVRLISSVSGSSLTAAYYGLYGREGLHRFRQDVLAPGLEDGLRLSLNPLTFMRLVQGAVNIRADFGDSLDKRVFHGATFEDLYRASPVDVRINATELYHRVAFPFIPQAFQALCSDITQYSVADAVAASMAVPLVFAPTVLRSYPESCPPDSEELKALESAAGRSHSVRALTRMVRSFREPEPKYLKLADGGLTDNFAVATLTMSRLVSGTPYAPMTARDAVRVRRLLVVSVDASRGLAGDWLHSESGPGGVDLALAAMDSAIDTASNLAADAFDEMIVQWRSSVVTFRCGLTRDEARALGASADWNCADVQVFVGHVSATDLEPGLRKRVEAIPTRLALPIDQIDDAIEGGRRSIASLSEFQEYLAQRSR